MTACSETGSDGSPPDTPLVEPIEFPFVEDATVKEFSPKKSTSTHNISINSTRITSDQGLIVPLDTDQSVIINDEDDNPVIDHSPLPDFYAYASGQILYALETETRYNHTLFNFKNTRTPSRNEFICDLREVTTIDRESVNDGNLVTKNARAVYVHADNEATCDGDTPAFYLIRIQENKGKTFTIRVRKENEVEGSEEPEISVVSEEHVIFQGIRETIEQPLMEATTVFHERQNYGDQLGYLGYDLEEERFHFYQVDLSEESFTYEKLWELETPAFTFNAELQAPLIEDRFGEYLFIVNGWSLYRIPKDSLFDEAADDSRETAFSSPVYTFSVLADYDPEQLLYDYSNSADQLITQDEDLTISISRNNQALEALRQINDPTLESLASYAIHSGVFLKKEFTNTSAITSLDRNNGQESTILGKNGPSNILQSSPNNNLMIDFFDSNLSMERVARRFVNSAGTYSLGTSHYDSLWATLSKRYDASTSLLLVQGLSTDISNERGSIRMPQIFTYSTVGTPFDPEQPIGQIPTTVQDVTAVEVITDDYGVVSILNNDGETERYYFNPSDPLLNNPSADSEDTETRRMMQRIN